MVLKATKFLAAANIVFVCGCSVPSGYGAHQTLEEVDRATQREIVTDLKENSPEKIRDALVDALERLRQGNTTPCSVYRAGLLALYNSYCEKDRSYTRSTVNLLKWAFSKTHFDNPYYQDKARFLALCNDWGDQELCQLGERLCREHPSDETLFLATLTCLVGATNAPNFSPLLKGTRALHAKYPALTRLWIWEAFLEAAIGSTHPQETRKCYLAARNDMQNYLRCGLRNDEAIKFANTYIESVDKCIAKLSAQKG